MAEAPGPGDDAAGVNTPAAGLVAFGCASLAGYRLALPRSVAAIASPGLIAGRALALGSLLSVGTFSLAAGGVMGAFGIRSARDLTAAARAAAPGLRVTGAPRPEDEARPGAIVVDLRGD